MNATCIDFGTTTSGSCYAVTGRMSPKESRERIYPSIIHVNDWPKQNYLQSKTPSIIVCDRNFHLLHWGMSAFNFIQSGQVKDGHRVFEKFKSQLPSSIAQKGAFRRTGNTSQLELLCLRATIDYFRELFDHTARAMENANMVKGLKVDKEDIRFLITVPTQWNDVQKSLMRLIAIEAGLISKYDNVNRLKIISESSAALNNCHRKLLPKILSTEDTEGVITFEGGKYMICDAGGGTVSIAIFEVFKQRGQDGEDSLRRCQITSGIQKKCGSAYLDLKMKEVLLDICFGADKKSWEDNESKIKELESLITPLTDQFLMNKTYFGSASRDFIPDCCREFLKNYDPEASDDDELYCGVCDFANGNDAQYIGLDNFGGDTVFIIELGRILKKLRLQKGPGDKIITEEGVTVERDKYHFEIRLSYKFMREKVFDEVVDNTIDFLKRQIKKANGNITHTNLVGGFGGSPYLRKRILNELPFGHPLHIGSLITDDRGDTAAMRGALIYGIDSSRHETQTDIVLYKYENAATSKYNALVCLDIGYDGIACSYRDLRNRDDNMTDIEDW
ncbi:uncharacterized protein EV154DRAFT_17814 [Mucor mucedo]|uniref:uncharacterized protein n=1 Tax=Mucor mucedo TaxID=29922 RepID=UPI002220052A|nr:uncharacterized protein EV154DRAFT_17814 [Mucor mucedo]KAI7886386.1 hypothetical protein EV154DRAFT_17814 [Mucor mucedo]